MRKYVLGVLVLAATLLGGCGTTYKTRLLEHHFIDPHSPHAVVTTDSERLAIDSIDGVRTDNLNLRFWVVTHAADAYRLTPRKHRFACSYRKNRLQTYDDLEIELTLQAGYRYVIGVEPAPETPKRYRAVLRRTEPMATAASGS